MTVLTLIPAGQLLGLYTKLPQKNSVVGRRFLILALGYFIYIFGLVMCVLSSIYVYEWLDVAFFSSIALGNLVFAIAVGTRGEGKGQ
jgi:hypothetical protein